MAVSGFCVTISLEELIFQVQEAAARSQSALAEIEKAAEIPMLALNNRRVDYRRMASNKHTNAEGIHLDVLMCVLNKSTK